MGERITLQFLGGPKAAVQSRPLSIPMWQKKKEMGCDAIDDLSLNN